MDALSAVTVLSTYIPAVAAVIHFRKTNRVFLPFLLVIWLGAANELLSYLVIRASGNNGLNGNIYVLVEGILILWLFRRWGRLNHSWINFTSLSSLFLWVWVLENLIIYSIYEVNSIYRCLSSFIIVFLSLHQINFIIVRERKNILNNATFITCLAFVIFFSYKAAIEVFYIFKAGLSFSFFSKLFKIFQVVNTLTNILFTIAILWIQKRQMFTLPY